MALRCLGCLPTITSNISGVKDAQRSRRQSIWAVYTSLRHTAKYTGFGCISLRIQPARIVPARLSRYTAHTAYTAIQPYTPYIIQRYTASLSKRAGIIKSFADLGEAIEAGVKNAKTAGVERQQIAAVELRGKEIAAFRRRLEQM